MEEVTNVTELKPKKEPVSINLTWGEVALVIVGYTVGCRLFGYRMVKPSHMKDGVLVVRTIGGRLLKSSIGA